MTWTRRRTVVALISVISGGLLLAACAPAGPVSTPDAIPSTAPPGAGATATPEPEDVDPAAFLLTGTPGVFDADGFWSGHYGFFADASKSVRCDIYIFSGDSGGLTCAITLGNEGLRSYTVPPEVATDCDPSASNASDGYSVGINFKVFETGSAGFTGCRQWLQQADPTILAATKVLADNQTLIVESANESFVCAVAAGVADCSEASSGARVRFGTGVATFEG
jgi:hypothetical protein